MNRKPSGHFDTRRSDDDEPRRIDGRVKRRAENIAMREVGAAVDWPLYEEQAEGQVDWEGYEKWLADLGWKLVATYDYRGPDGLVLYQCIRFQYELFPSKKRFILRHRVGSGKWIHDGGPVRVPYNLPELSKRRDDPITLVEGEKGVDFLKEKGVLASCVQGQNWSGDVVRPFAGRIVNVAMDNDDAGQENVKDAVEWLGKVGATVRVITLPGLAPGDGLDDWLASHDVAEYDDIATHAKAEPPSDGAIVAVPHDFPSESTLPLWKFLYGSHLLRKTVSGTAAMGATGKSSLSIVEALAMTTGRPLLKSTVPAEPLLRVLLINLEDNREAVNKRIAAAMKHHKLTKEDVGERLFTIAKGEIKFKIAMQPRSGSVARNEPNIKGMIGFLIKNKIDVFSIDPFISTHAVNENDNSAIRSVIEIYDEIAEAANCAVSIWHHTRKGNGAEASIDSARGAGSFADACRSVRILETMTAAEAKKNELPRHSQYFRSFSGKLNFAPPTDKSDWFQIVSVPLNNKLVLACDEIGVVDTWTPPANEKQELEMSEISNICCEVAKAEWREDVRSSMWVGKAVANALNLSADDNKEKIKGILKTLLRNKTLKTRAGKANNRHDAIFIEVGNFSGSFTTQSDDRESGEM